MHNSPLKCTTNDASSPQKFQVTAAGQSYKDYDAKASPVKNASAAASNISPEKRTRENLGGEGETYQSPPRSRKIGSPAKLKGSPASIKKRSTANPFGKPIEIIRSKSFLHPAQHIGFFDPKAIQFWQP